MKRHFEVDLWLLAPSLLLALTGLATLAALNTAFLKGQAFSLIIASLVFIFITRLDHNIFKNLKKPIYLASLILLLVVLFIGIESRGAMRWVEIFGIRVQLSETFKPLLSLAFAAHIADSRKLGLKTLFSTTLLLAPVALLIYYQPDLGNALIYLIVYLITLIIIGFPILWLALFFLLPFVLLLPIIWNLLHEYQRQRLITFVNPLNDPFGTSYNSIQAIVAVGSGLIFGKGLGEGTQSGLKFLPERHTDFIFAALSEGMGLIGGLIIILSFAALLFRLYAIFNNAKDLFEKTFIITCFLFIFIQFILNIGMNTGLFPVVGITLPFVSYGGSSLVANSIFLAVASSISISNKNRDVLEIR
jgi:rod shape determining protein RodA